MKIFKLNSIIIPLLFFALSGCSTLRFVAEFDSNIESTLNQYHVSVGEFIEIMNTKKTKISGNYANGSVQEYYASSNAILANLVVQAEAADPSGNCFASKTINASMSILANTAIQPITLLEEKFNFDSGLSKLLDPKDTQKFDLSLGSCTTITIKVVAANNLIIQKFHKEEIFLTKASADIFKAIIQDGIRIALKAELSKKGL
ncbi:MAG: hypothetical protein COC24_005275 [Alphaproteobacteria bacterium]|nr:hypothetical protein [Alphaproteobacteria bacterium]